MPPIGPAYVAIYRLEAHRYTWTHARSPLYEKEYTHLAPLWALYAFSAVWLSAPKSESTLWDAKELPQSGSW